MTPGFGNLVFAGLQADAGRTANYGVYGVFTDTAVTVPNAAECWISPGALCFDTWPTADDTYVDLDPAAAFDPSAYTTQFPGDPMVFADVELTTRPIAEGRFYYGNAAAWTGGAAAGLSFIDGSWGNFDNANVLTLPDLVEIIAPDDSETIDPIPSTGTLNLEWTPGNGSFGVVVEAGTHLRFWQLADDGAFALDLAGEGIPASASEVVLYFQRWESQEVVANGNPIDVLVRSERRVTVPLFNVGSRTELTLADTCGAATTPVAAGSYFGTLDGNSNTLNPGAGGCTGWPAAAADGIIPVELQNNERLRARGVMADHDTSLYIVTDCGDANTCVDGSDTPGDGLVEVTAYHNTSGSAETVYVVLDSAVSVGAFFLDLEIETVLPANLSDTCNGAPALAAGRYAGTTVGLSDDYDPGTNGCTGTALAGPDGVLSVTLADLERVTVDLDMLGDNGALYMLTNCNQTNSCVEGADAGSGRETLTFTNTTGSQQTYSLIVDSAGTGGAFELEVLFESLQPIGTNDCASVWQGTPLSEGLYAGTLDRAGDINDGLDCGISADGDDTYAPIEVPADHAARLTYTQPDGDAVLLLVDDCRSGTCLDSANDTGVGGVESILVINTGTAPLTRYVNLDSIGAGGAFEFSYELLPLADSWTEGFEFGAPGYGTYGGDNSPWTVDNTVSYGGGSSLASPDISDSQETWWEIAVRSDGASQLSFWYLADTEGGWDELWVYVDSNTYGPFDDTTWTQVTVPVPDGDHTIRFSYEKDSSYSDGLDKVWIDDIVLIGGTVQ
ncbi:MAG: hypothetical protein EP330_07970 [Deltaproteobacteria bacterium]|nr:MAG: hypothetical protein EP330_07970 [Deltaproteobacteria bacterium]